MTKDEVAAALDEIGTLLELKGEVTFRTRAYHTGSRIISQFTGDLKQLIAERKAADLGSDNRGRLALTHAAGTTSLTLSESAIAGVRDNFGFSIEGVQSVPDAGRIASSFADGGFFDPDFARISICLSAGAARCSQSSHASTRFPDHPRTERARRSCRRRVRS